jgi:hypothetical protein
MSDDIPPLGSDQDSDYDGAWKEALRRFLRAFLAMYFPVEFAAIDWTVEPEWCDKELSQVIGQAGKRNRRVDVLVKVRLLDGQEQWILVHLEIQSSYEEEFAARISLYNAGISWLCQRRVVTLVVLADLRRGWVPDEDHFQVGGFESRLKFPVCKLIGRLETDWRDDHSLPVLVARAQIEALRTAGDPEGRYRAKRKLVLGLYDLGYNAHEVREIFLLLDWMMHLRLDLEKQLTREIIEYEETRKMPYVTSVERFLQERAEARGEARGEARVVLSLLAEVCGDLPDDCEDRVRQLPVPAMDKLAKALLRFQSLDDLNNWLERHEEASNE